MKSVKCINSNKSVSFFDNGNTVLVFAQQDGEYWFTIGKGYKTLNGAKRSAVKEMAKMGYTIEPKALESLTF